MEDDVAISMAEARNMLSRALSAIVSGDVHMELTEDVVGESPSMAVRSRSELEFPTDRSSRSAIEHRIRDRAGRRGRSGARFATWSMSGDHTGELLVNEDEFFEPSGRRIELSATSYVRLRGGQICAFRSVYGHGDLVISSASARSPTLGDTSGHGTMSPASCSLSTASRRMDADCGRWRRRGT